MTSDLNSDDSPDFVWYTPNLTDDGHTGVPVYTAAQELADGDAFLTSFVPSVQATAWYKSGGQIIIEWDEALDSDTSGLNAGSGGHVPTIVVSAALKASPEQDSTPVDTVGILRSIEDTYGLPYLGGDAADGSIDTLLNPPSPTTTTTPASPTSPDPTTPPTPTPTSPTTGAPTTSPPTTSTPPTTPVGTTPVPTSTTVTVVPEVGSSVQGLTASVSPVPAGGTVQFVVDGWVVGNAIPISADGTALMALYLSDGPHLVEADYSGSAPFDSSSVTIVAGVGQAPTSLTAAAPAWMGSGHHYQLSATLNSGEPPFRVLRCGSRRPEVPCV